MQYYNGRMVQLFGGCSNVTAVRDALEIPGLGTFESRERSAREGRNPQTGETMQIAATTVPGFKAAAAFKQATAK